MDHTATGSFPCKTVTDFFCSTSRNGTILPHLLPNAAVQLAIYETVKERSVHSFCSVAFFFQGIRGFTKLKISDNSRYSSIANFEEI